MDNRGPANLLQPAGLDQFPALRSGSPPSLQNSASDATLDGSAYDSSPVKSYYAQPPTMGGPYAANPTGGAGPAFHATNAPHSPSRSQPPVGTGIYSHGPGYSRAQSFPPPCNAVAPTPQFSQPPRMPIQQQPTQMHFATPPPFAQNPASQGGYGVPSRPYLSSSQMPHTPPPRPQASSPSIYAPAQPAIVSFVPASPLTPTMAPQQHSPVHPSCAPAGAYNGHHAPSYAVSMPLGPYQAPQAPQAPQGMFFKRPGQTAAEPGRGDSEATLVEEQSPWYSKMAKAVSSSATNIMDKVWTNQAAGSTDSPRKTPLTASLGVGSLSMNFALSPKARAVQPSGDRLV